MPGAPTRSTPFGIFPPSRRYRSGFFRKSTISISSLRASSMPAMSSNVTPVLFSTYTFARLLPMDMSPLWGFIRFMTNIQSPTKTTAGRIHDSSVASHVLAACPVNRTWAASSSPTSPGSSTRVVTKSGALFPDFLISSIFSFERMPSSPAGDSVPWIVSGYSASSLTFPARSRALNSLYDMLSGRGTSSNACTANRASIAATAYHTENVRCFGSMSPAPPTAPR